MRIAAAVSLLLLAVLALFGMRTCAQEADVASAVDSEADEDLVLVGTVERIIDADTLEVQLDSGGIEVRMQGSDAPERGAPMSDEAIALLSELVADGEVELQPAEQTSYERMVARIYVGGSDVNAAMLKRGFAMADRRFLREFDDGEDYCVFEHAARSAKLGIWALPADQRIAPWEWRENGRMRFTDYGTATAATCIAAIGKSLREQPLFEPLPQFEKLRDSRCGTKRTCGEMESCAEAKFYFESCGVRSLDGGERDGVPCNNLCD
jgi:endonuclease YncB( thermonuclease family)